MTVFRPLLAAFLVLFLGLQTVSGQNQKACFYLDKGKVKSEFTPLILASAGVPKTDSIHLEKGGLFEGENRTCLWSLNGGSGTKELFALDGGYAVPILDPRCEMPFSHEETGVGFGDWYLTLCGTLA